ncbi:MAG TPA: alpha-amylase family glycosyl hydrolase, partial [Gemmata sp.]|nr:alpha-amylase family glycosyl hydrolase [Gemmata sp.]
GGKLLACDPGGDRPDFANDGRIEDLPANNRLVIYELPTAWASRTDLGGVEIGVGTFRDTRALIEPGAEAANFSGVEVMEPGRAHLLELGANALELLPPADSWTFREWGYATSNYFAADFDLGFPNYNASPTSSLDLVALIAACHRNKIRFFLDVVMAFATRYSLQNLNYLDFHVRRGTGDPEEKDYKGEDRQDFGGKLFKYAYFTEAYDPLDGNRRSLSPSRQLLKANLANWMETYRIDGVRIDSTKNIVNWDFLREFTTLGRDLFRQRWIDSGQPADSADARFLTVGEELPPRLGLVTTGRLDGLWNEPFMERVRCALLGENHHDDPDFETTVQRMIDCSRVGYPDGSAAINYLTSHDVEGYRKERLFRFFWNNGFWLKNEKGEEYADTERIARRVKLGFACLLTAVGVPMILAGEEFADDHDRAITHPAKQSDPVNFDRASDGWRKGIIEYVSRLVKFRIASDALSVNDTEFIHADFTPGRRVLAWCRGRPGVDDPVVVVANFSEYDSA